MRRAALLLLLLPSACSALLGVDFDGHLPGVVDDGATVESGAAVVPDDSGARAEGDGGYLAQKPALDALRVRLGDAPPRDKYFTSKSWVYWTDATGAGHALRPTDGATRAIAGPFQCATDDHVVDTNKISAEITLRPAAGGSATANFKLGVEPPIAIDDRVIFWSEGSTSTSVLSWVPSAPSTRTTLGTLPSASTHPIGHSGHAVYLMNGFDRTQLLVADVGVPGLHAVSLAVTATAAVDVPAGIVVTHVIGAETQFLLVPQSGATVNLSAQILAAESDVPAAVRAPFGPAVAYGEWIVFSSLSGILAFRPSDHALRTVQLRSPRDGYAFSGVETVPGSGAVVFTIATVIQGLYVVKLDGVLTP